MTRKLLPLLLLTMSCFAQTNPIKHVVFIVRENRSFDSYFGTFPNADGATKGTLSNGTVIPLSHLGDQMPHDMGHDWWSGLEVCPTARMICMTSTTWATCKGITWLTPSYGSRTSPIIGSTPKHSCWQIGCFHLCMAPACQTICTP